MLVVVGPGGIFSCPLLPAPLSARCVGSGPSSEGPNAGDGAGNGPCPVPGWPRRTTEAAIDPDPAVSVMPLVAGNRQIW